MVCAGSIFISIDVSEAYYYNNIIIYRLGAYYAK